jgi:hypothetical protein
MTYWRTSRIDPDSGWTHRKLLFTYHLDKKCAGKTGALTKAEPSLEELCKRCARKTALAHERHSPGDALRMSQS